MPFSYFHPLDDPDRKEFAHILAWAFGFDAKDAPAWLELGGLENLRGLREGAQLVGGLLTLPLGQYFGGQLVEMVGIAGVAVVAEARGRGAALHMMRAAARELHERRVALSTLYPASVSLYRKAGWELAGYLFDVSVDIARIGVRSPKLELQPSGCADQSLLEQMYRSLARQRDGYVERSDYIWSRVFSPRKRETRATRLSVEGQPVGYVVMLQDRLPSDYHDLRLTDAQCTSVDGARGILGFLAQHGTMAKSVRWAGSAIDPLVWQMPERTYSIGLREHWMTRICHVQAALEQRGYATRTACELDLLVRDPDIPEQSGLYRLAVEGGRATVSRPARSNSAVELDVGALAALYTGFASPALLAQAGQLSGSSAALAAAEAAFPRGMPSMVDFF
ncbi:MAG: GNAT family N-acetyltransferase [Polyangiaceae bacterium]